MLLKLIEQVIEKVKRELVENEEIEDLRQDKLGTGKKYYL